MSFDYDDYKMAKELSRMDRQIQDLQNVINDIQKESTIINNNTTLPSTPGYSETDIDNMIEPKRQTDTFTGTEAKASIDLTASSYEEIMPQMVSTGSGSATILIQSSNDDSNWDTEMTFTIVDAETVNPPVKRINADYVRANCTAYSGLTDVKINWRISV